jgi:copper resistance protein B
VKRRLPALLATTILLGWTAPAVAQSGAMHGMHMPGMTMPAQPKAAKPKQPARPKAKATPRPTAAKPAATKAKPAPVAKTPAAPMEGMDHAGHGGMPGMSAPPSAPAAPAAPAGHGDHSGHVMPGMTAAPAAVPQQSGTALPAGNAPAPPAPTDHAADGVFAPAAMAMARHHLQAHHGGGTFHQVMINLAELQTRSGRDGYRWDGEAWYGGDVNRLWLKTEGEGEFRRGLDEGEVQALYSRAIDPYFNLQAGARQNFGRGPDRTYAAVSIEGLAPGFFEVEGALFLSTKGDLLGRVEGYYDQRVTQRLVLQPRVEFNLAAQDVPANGIGSGLVDAELGLRLRYEIAREFAPYVGVSYTRKSGDTARLARTAGEDVGATSFVVGLRTWF